MNNIKKQIIALALIGALAPVVNMHAMHNGPHAYEEDHKEAMAVEMPARTPEQIEQANAQLIQAVDDNNLEAAEKAIADGANINIYIGVPLLTQAINKDRPDMVDLLLQHNAEIKPSSIVACAFKPNLSLLNRLLSHSPDLNAIDHNLGQTAANQTAAYRVAEAIAYSHAYYPDRLTTQKNTLKMLVFAGADLSIETHFPAARKILTLAPNTPFARLPHEERNYILEAITLQQKDFKIIETLQSYIAETIHDMPADLVTLIADYAIPFYTSHDMDDWDENDQPVVDTLNRSIAKKWESIKKNAPRTEHNKNRVHQLNQIQTKRVVNFCLLSAGLIGLSAIGLKKIPALRFPFTYACMLTTGMFMVNIANYKEYIDIDDD